MLPAVCRSSPRLRASLLLALLLLALFFSAPFLIPDQGSAQAQALLTDEQYAAILGGEQLLLNLDVVVDPGSTVYVPVILK